MTNTIDVTIDAVGSRGDGLARAPDGTALFVPLTVPGDQVRVRSGQARAGGAVAEVMELLAVGGDRVAARCAHYASCGGCSLQHWSDSAVLEWKRGKVRAALGHRGLETSVAPTLATPPGERRRARLAVKRGGDTIALGFRARASRRVVPLGLCPLLAPGLQALLMPLKEFAAAILQSDEEAQFELTQTDGGVDLVVESARRLGPDVISSAVAFASAHGLARVSWRADASGYAELVVRHASTEVVFGGVSVEIPAGAFIQASQTAEAALVGEVLAATAKAKRVADLFAGCGAFTFPLAGHAQVHAVESNATAVAAVAAAASGRAGMSVTAEVRDLERRPLMDNELAKYDAVVLDPPRRGARPQAEVLAKSTVRTVAYVSCDIGTFARDARLLVNGGYVLQKVVPVDQFLWSAHVELVGVFTKEIKRR
jgi:23S rRNA (uracil1939-C5)-methyltransferase